jgi:hypothetical protein
MELFWIVALDSCLTNFLKIIATSIYLLAAKMHQISLLVVTKIVLESAQKLFLKKLWFVSYTLEARISLLSQFPSHQRHQGYFRNIFVFFGSPTTKKEIYKSALNVDFGGGRSGEDK